MADLSRLIGRLQGADGPDKELDMAIARAVGRVRKVMVDPYDGGAYIDVAPPFTRSLDAALDLVPPGWFWRCGRTTLFAGWACVHECHPNHTEPGHNECGFHRERDTTPVLALCVAALKAWETVNG